MRINRVMICYLNFFLINVHFWSAKQVQLSTFVPVLRYILSLRYRDVAMPGAKYF